MLTITVVAVGKLNASYFKEGCEEYLKRLSAFCKVNIIELKEDKSSDINKVIQNESENILKHLTNKRAKTVALCVEGKKISSEQLADFIKNTELQHSEIVFIIGGSYGLSQQLKNSVDCRISLSDMTFVHQMSRMILLEQVYRAFTINKNIKYHK